MINDYTLIIMLVISFIVSALLFGFTGYHLLLIYKNKTTN